MNRLHRIPSPLRRRSLSLVPRSHPLCAAGPSRAQIPPPIPHRHSLRRPPPPSLLPSAAGPLVPTSPPPRLVSMDAPSLRPRPGWRRAGEIRLTARWWWTDRLSVLNNLTPRGLPVRAPIRAPPPPGGAYVCAGPQTDVSPLLFVVPP
ncbi:hypothetical protein PVAP13_1KG266200 [Panicum virgatum]|uniref:Uncharacterized protein n=1 Tax=Panicum virgatum TaxID=38727 RepID=A0A8T0XH52_PANVG|nr:hypothetical protein PVAP13_1KG266200 [Panicum virgatum]